MTVTHWARKYTDEQKAAILAAIAGGMSCPQAVKAAAAGNLGLPAFTMPTTTAQDLRRREMRRQANEQRERDVNANPERAVLVLTADLLAIASRAMHDMARDTPNRRQPWAELKEAARAVRELDQLTKARLNGIGNGDQAHDDTRPNAAGLVARLAESTTNAAPNQDATHQASEPGTQREAQATPADTSQSEQTSEQSEKAVRGGGADSASRRAAQGLLGGPV